LTDRALASHLSNFLWSTVPDDALSRLADENSRVVLAIARVIIAEAEISHLAG
jgi:hypothetical protein